jgi:hypothetical protein
VIGVVPIFGRKHGWREYKIKSFCLIVNQWKDKWDGPNDGENESKTE